MYALDFHPFTALAFPLRILHATAELRLRYRMRDGCKLRSGVTTCLREMGGVEKYEGKVWGKNILTVNYYTNAPKGRGNGHLEAANGHLEAATGHVEAAHAVHHRGEEWSRSSHR